MKSFLNYGKFLQIFLWLVGIHSLIVGINLIFVPTSLMPFFGFQNISENFFRAQGGVFHIVLFFGYILAAWNLQKNHILIIFAIIAKAIATVFLFTYFILIAQIWTVLFSGIVDAIMGLIIFWAYFNHRKYLKSYSKI